MSTINYLNGFNKPQVKIYINGLEVGELNFSLPTDKPMTKETKIDFLYEGKKDIEGNEVAIVEGFRYCYEFPYIKYCNAETLEAIYHLLNWFAKKKIYTTLQVQLIPNIDVPWISDYVVLDMDSVTYALLFSRENTAGMQEVNLKLKSASRKQYIDWLNKNNPPYMILQKSKLFNIVI